jgi:hypothetical protein
VNVNSPEIRVHTEVAVWVVAKRRLGPNARETDVSWEESSACTTRAAGVGVQASRKRPAEITSGRAVSQQGLAATCKDPLTKARTVGGRRDSVWRMRAYELWRRGNTL